MNCESLSPLIKISFWQNAFLPNHVFWDLPLFNSNCWHVDKLTSCLRIITSVGLGDLFGIALFVIVCSYLYFRFRQLNALWLRLRLSYVDVHFELLLKKWTPIFFSSLSSLRGHYHRRRSRFSSFSNIDFSKVPEKCDSKSHSPWRKVGQNLTSVWHMVENMLHKEKIKTAELLDLIVWCKYKWLSIDHVIFVPVNYIDLRGVKEKLWQEHWRHIRIIIFMHGALYIYR